MPASPLQLNTANDQSLLQVEKPREDYIMVIDADSILRKPFLPEELHLKLGALPGSAQASTSCPALQHDLQVTCLHL